MKKRVLILISTFIFIFLLSSCLAHTEVRKEDYDILSTAATFSSDKVIGEYGGNIPDDFDGVKFLKLVKEKIPTKYYHALKKYDIELIPMKTYYLLKVYHEKKLILFDYSCTTEADGRILEAPEKYDINNLHLYDECKKLTPKP